MSDRGNRNVLLSTFLGRGTYDTRTCPIARDRAPGRASAVPTKGFIWCRHSAMSCASAQKPRAEALPRGPRRRSGGDREKVSPDSSRRRQRHGRVADAREGAVLDGSVAVADAAGPDPDPHLPRPGLRHAALHQPARAALPARAPAPPSPVPSLPPVIWASPRPDAIKAPAPLPSATRPDPSRARPRRSRAPPAGREPDPLRKPKLGPPGPLLTTAAACRPVPPPGTRRTSPASPRRAGRSASRARRARPPRGGARPRARPTR